MPVLLSVGTLQGWTERGGGGCAKKTKKNCVRINFYGLIRLENNFPEELTDVFGDYLTGSEYVMT